jgi:hypothetical protein
LRLKKITTHTHATKPSHPEEHMSSRTGPNKKTRRLLTSAASTSPLPSWHKLDRATLSVVIDHLNLRTWAKLHRVSKFWRRAAMGTVHRGAARRMHVTSLPPPQYHEPLPVRSLTIELPTELQSSANCAHDLLHMLQRFPYLATLKTIDVALSSAVLHWVASNPHLTSIDISDDSMDTKSWPALSPAVTDCHLRGNKKNPMDWRFLQHAHLTTLGIRCIPVLSSPPPSVLANLTNLEVTSISRTICLFILASVPLLRSIDISDFSTGWPVLSPALTDCHLHGNANTPMDWTFLQHTNLTTLEIRRIPVLSSPSPSLLANLTTLELDVTNISHTICLFILESAPLLQELDLEGLDLAETDSFAVLRAFSHLVGFSLCELVMHPHTFAVLTTIRAPSLNRLSLVDPRDIEGNEGNTAVTDLTALSKWPSITEFSLMCSDGMVHMDIATMPLWPDLSVFYSDCAWLEGHDDNTARDIIHQLYPKLQLDAFQLNEYTDSD